MANPVKPEKAVRQGYLNKHVNALKGYQSRFFVVNSEHGRLEYFLTKDAFVSSPQDYRGCIQLTGAEVSCFYSTDHQTNRRFYFDLLNLNIQNWR